MVEIICEEKGPPPYYWWDCRLVQPLWKTIYLKIWLPYDLAISPLGTYQEKIKSIIQKDTCPPMFRVALFTYSSQGMEATQMSIDIWMDKNVQGDISQQQKIMNY